jgi:hypothetical protein
MTARRILMWMAVTAGILMLLNVLTSCNVVHKHKSLQISRRDSTGSLTVADTHGSHTDSTELSHFDSSYLSGVITAGDSGVDISTPYYSGRYGVATLDSNGVITEWRVEKAHGTITPDSSWEEFNSAPIKVHLSKGSTVTFQKGHVTAIHESQKKTTDTTSHNQQQTSAVQEKEKTKTDNSKSERIPWVGIIMVGLLLGLVMWTWKNKVIGPL